MRIFSSASVLFLSLAWGACDAPSPDHESTPSAVKSSKLDDAPSQAAAPKPKAKTLNKYLWRWISASAQSSYMAQRHKIDVVGGVTLKLTSTREGLALRLEPDESSARAGWTTEISDPTLSDGEMVMYSQEWAFVVAYSRISSGGQLIAVNINSGKLLWRKPLKALGAVNHSQYVNEVQLYVDQGRVIIHGMESGGCYTEIRSRDDGALIDAERVDCELVKPPEQWLEPSREEPEAVSHINPDSHTVISLNTNRHGVSVKGFELDYKGASRWRRRFNAELATHGLLAVDHDYIYVAKASRHTSGAQVLAFDRRDGAPLWTSNVFGVGPLAPLRYINTLQTLTVTPRGVELYAAESSCSYLEVIDPKTGRTLINHRYYTG